MVIIFQILEQVVLQPCHMSIRLNKSNLNSIIFFLKHWILVPRSMNIIAEDGNQESIQKSRPRSLLPFPCVDSSKRSMQQASLAPTYFLSSNPTKRLHVVSYLLANLFVNYPIQQFMKEFHFIFYHPPRSCNDSLVIEFGCHHTILIFIPYVLCHRNNRTIEDVPNPT